jgi:hypothetical protein
MIVVPAARPASGDTNTSTSRPSTAAISHDTLVSGAFLAAT